jgi:hypothetical protein
VLLHGRHGGCRAEPACFVLPWAGLAAGSPPLYRAHGSPTPGRAYLSSPERGALGRGLPAAARRGRHSLERACRASIYREPYPTLLQHAEAAAACSERAAPPLTRATPRRASAGPAGGGAEDGAGRAGPARPASAALPPPADVHCALEALLAGRDAAPWTPALAAARSPVVARTADLLDFYGAYAATAGAPRTLCS